MSYETLKARPESVPIEAAVPALSFDEALGALRKTIESARPRPAKEAVRLERARGRVLAEDVFADRDYPPFERATRDGFAVRAAEVATVPALLEVAGTARAGTPYDPGLAPDKTGRAVEIMTGLPLPHGTDAVVMIEHTRERVCGADVARTVEILRSVAAWENVVRRGSETTAGGRVLARGRRLGPGEIGLAAMVGATELQVYRRPRVAILPTGDEVVAAADEPRWFEIRNSNALSLAAQVEEAGGEPILPGIARDDQAALRRLIEEGLGADLLVLSGGISAGKYDLVAAVLAELGAEFYFRQVALRPGKPLTFGRVKGCFFLALPGNPVSTFVTFELFGRPAISLVGGAGFEPPQFLRARLGKPVRQKTGLTMFMPARVAPRSRPGDDPVVELVGWQGSGDLVGLAGANCLLVIHPEQGELAAGDWVDVLPRQGQ